MNKKTFIVVFIMQYVALLLSAFLFFFYKDLSLNMMPEDKAQVAYLLDVFCALFTVASAFLVIKQRQWNPLLRLALLTVPALLALISFFFFDDSNMIYSLPILGIVSFILLKQTLED